MSYILNNIETRYGEKLSNGKHTVRKVMSKGVPSLIERLVDATYEADKSYRIINQREYKNAGIWEEEITYEIY